MASPLAFSGVNCTTGEYLPAPFSVNDLYQALSGNDSRDLLQERRYQNLLARHDRDKAGPPKRYGVADTVDDPNQLDQTGWGIIFPRDAPDELLQSLAPLIEHRTRQVKDTEKRKYKYLQVFEKKRGYHPNDDKASFLRRLGKGIGHPADPTTGVPYYLLLIGSAVEIPWEFQFDLDVEYAVGRIFFADDQAGHDYAAYRRYAEGVVRAEESAPRRSRKASFFSPRHDLATQYSSDLLVKPLLNALQEHPRLGNWKFDAVRAEEADKSKLSELFHNPDAGFLFTAGHGGWFDETDRRAPQDQGALLCQKNGEFGGGQVPASNYFSHADLSQEADFSGLISFHFACYGLGTPSVDGFPDMFSKTFPNTLLRKQPEIARLPMSLLSHPGGAALAFIGHVDRAWSCSFLNTSRKPEFGTFSSTLGSLLRGNRLGSAMEYFNNRNAALAAQISSKLQRMRMKLDKETDPFKEEYVADWLEQIDARNYAIFGDPAVKLSLRDEA